MGVAEQARKLTEAEYLDLERAAEFRSEFHDGEMFAMAGGTRWHSLIAGNLIREFGNRLKGRDCVPYESNLRVKVEATGLFTYPDLSVACGEQRFLDREVDTLLTPTLIAEVLSDSTERYDRSTTFDHYKKFEHYQEIPTLKEYLLVSQWEPRIDQYLRQASGDWLLRPAVGLEAALVIPSLDITVSLARVFANVKFVPGPIRPQTPRPL